MKILILTAATGAGHLTAARGLAEAFQSAAPDAEIRVLDTCTHPAIRAASASYNFFLRRPPRWMNAYYRAVHWARLPQVGAAVTRRWASQILAAERPDLAVSVHPILNFGIADTQERHGGEIPFAIVLTDPYPPFWKGWAEPRASRTVVPTPAAAQQLAAWGVPADRIEVGGMPIRTLFQRPANEESRRSVRESLGLEEGRFTLLINAGSAGRKTSEWVLKRLAAARDLHDRIQIVFVAGRNRLLGSAGGQARDAVSQGDAGLVRGHGRAAGRGGRDVYQGGRTLGLRGDGQRSPRAGRRVRGGSPAGIGNGGRDRDRALRLEGPRSRRTSCAFCERPRKGNGPSGGSRALESVRGGAASIARSLLSLIESARAASPPNVAESLS